MNDIVSLFAKCVTACAEQPPKERRVKKGAYGGPLWNVDVPVAKSTVERLLKYATDKERFVYEGNWATLIGLRATDVGLVATISSEVMGRRVTASMTVEYANDAERKLFSGEWTPVKYGEVKLYPTQLLPTVTATSFGAVISVKAGVRRRRMFGMRWLLGEYQTFELHGFRVTPSYGEVLTGSDMWDFVTPRFVWSMKDQYQ